MFSNIASFRFFFLVIISILYSVPPSKLLQVHKVKFSSHAFTVNSDFSSLFLHLIKISSNEPLGKLLEFNLIVNEVDVLINFGLGSSLTLSSS